LNKRLLPWSRDQGIRLIKRFDDPITVKAFFNSWHKRKNVDNNVVFEMSDTHLRPNTKRAMMERYRSFLTFCKDNGWIAANHAKKIKISGSLLQCGGPVQYNSDGVRRRLSNLGVYQETPAIAARDIVHVQPTHSRRYFGLKQRLWHTKG
jgi:hypothetical protein